MASKNEIKTAQAKQERQWQVQSAVNTLQQAEQIKKDASLMRDVKKQVSEMQRAIGGNTKTPAKKKK